MEASKSIERALKSAHYEEMFLKLNKIPDEKNLFKTLDEMNEKEKEELEEAVIGLISRFELSDEMNIFYNKYKNYALKKAKDNNIEYLNNNYLRFLYHNEFQKIVKDNDYDSKINDKSIWDIYYDLCDRYNEIIAKMNRNEELTNEEKRYIKNFFISTAFYNTIEKETDGKKDIMYDIVEYFDKYPIDDIKSTKNKQLSLLYILSKQLINLNVNSVITFEKYHDKNDILSEGYFKQLNDGRYLINISNLDNIYLNTEEKFFDKLFTIFHEFGHVRQKIYKDKYPDAIKEQFAREKYIINNNKKFYKKFHDSFYMETDADRYALSTIIELFGKNNPENVSKLIDRKKSKKRIDSKTFYGIVLKKYEDLKQKEPIHSNKKHL